MDNFAPDPAASTSFSALVLTHNGYVATWAGGDTAAVMAIRQSGNRIARTARTILDGAAVTTEGEVTTE